MTGNQATSSSGSAFGGGLFAISGSLTVVRSSVTGNTASTGGSTAMGGGIAAQGPLGVTNSTIAGNSATATGGGSQALGGGIGAAFASSLTLPLTHVTLSGNTVSSPSFTVGGNLEAGNNVQMQLTGSIVAGGIGTAGSENCGVQGGSFASLGFNLEDRNQCGLGASELRNTAPQLQALGSNGGPTPTLALPFGSPARDAAGSCGLTTDQRGSPRTGPCDIGAFEYQPVAPVVTATADRTNALTGEAVGFSASATDADPGDTVTLAWAFDDGATATGASVSHAFAAPGRHTATATATDSTGAQATATATVDVSVRAVPPGGGADTTAPLLSGLALAPAAFPAAGSGPSAKAAARKPRAKGARASYRLSEAATVTFTVERSATGRRVGGRCVKPSRANRGARRCARFVKVRGSFTRTGKAGTNRFRFTGRLGGAKLAPGSYRLLALARDAAGNRSKVARQAFRIVR